MRFVRWLAWPDRARERERARLSAHIALLEREMGVDDATLLAPPDPPKKRELPAPVVLSPRTSPLMAFQPGARWQLENAAAAQMVQASSTSALTQFTERAIRHSSELKRTEARQLLYGESRVVLPPGVSAW